MKCPKANASEVCEASLEAPKVPRAYVEVHIAHDTIPTQMTARLTLG